MKVAVSFPPIKSEKGIPLLTQNRQFQWFNKPTYIYPMVPASMATLLSKNDCEVLWNDGIAMGESYEKWFTNLISFKPEVIFIESKTPVIKKHWEIIDQIKYKLSNTIVVLYGDHTTAFPEESLNNSKVDFVLTGGDYDFAALNLVNFLRNKSSSKNGFSYKKDDEFIHGGHLEVDNLDELPLIDRALSKWQLYAYKNGNFKFTPGTYTMFGRDCWWRGAGGCTFCSWTGPYRKFRVVKPERALEEVEALVSLGVKEIFDDTGTFPVGKWLKTFCEGVISRGLNKKLVFGCNMRPDALSYEEYSLMKKAGFRLILFGVESANQSTLDRVNKGAKIENIVAGIKNATKAGLESHITTMIGYPWETKSDAERTIQLTSDLFKKGDISTLQATVVIPYPGTRLYKECKENNWLLTEDYERFDQREQVMKSPLTTEDVLYFTRSIYKSFLTPSFILRKFLSIRSFQDVKFYFMAAFRVLGHLKDFAGK